MKEKIGEWFVVENLMSHKNVRQVLEIQKHEPKMCHTRFGKIALSKQMITGNQLRRWELAHHIF